MNFKRIGHLLVCLLLVVCLIVNISPLKAEALGPILPYFIYANLDDVLFAISLGLGVSFGVEAMEEGAAFLDNLKTYLKVNDIIEEAAETMALYSAGTSQYYVEQAMVEAVRDYLWDTAIVSEGTVEVEEEVTAPEGYMYYNDVISPNIESVWVDKETFPYAFICVGVDGYLFSNKYTCGLILSADLPYYSTRFGQYRNTSFYQIYGFGGGSDGGSWELLSSGSIVCITVNYYPLVWSSHDILYSDTGDLYFSGSEVSSVGTQTTTVTKPFVTDGLIAYEIASQDEDLPSGYPVWSGNAITVLAGTAGNDEDVTAYPIAVGDTLENTMNKTQADVWAGLSDALSETDSGTDTGTDTDTDENTTILEDILSGIKAIPDAIGNVFSEILSKLFVPSETYVESKVEALTSNFTFASSIAATGKDLKEFLITLGSEAPVISIPLGSATGSYIWGSDMVFVDFSFYDSYKPTMDAIISAFLWLWFCWRMILVLPGLISGASGIPGAVIDIASSERSSTSPSSASSSDKLSGYVYQTREQKQLGSRAYDEWRSKQK